MYKKAAKQIQESAEEIKESAKQIQAFNEPSATTFDMDLMTRLFSHDIGLGKPKTNQWGVTSVRKDGPNSGGFIAESVKNNNIPQLKALIKLLEKEKGFFSFTTPPWVTNELLDARRALSNLETIQSLRGTGKLPVWQPPPPDRQVYVPTASELNVAWLNGDLDWKFRDDSYKSVGELPSPPSVQPVAVAAKQVTRPFVPPDLGFGSDTLEEERQLWQNIVDIFYPAPEGVELGAANETKASEKTGESKEQIFIRDEAKINELTAKILDVAKQQAEIREQRALVAAKQVMLGPQYKDAITQVLENENVDGDLQRIDDRLKELGDAKLLSSEGREKTELQKQRAVLEVAQAKQTSATTYADSLVQQLRELEAKSNKFDVESQKLEYEAKGLANKMAIAEKIQIPADDVRQNMLGVAGEFLGEVVKEMKEGISDAVDAVRPTLNAAFDSAFESAFEWVNIGVHEQEMREAAKQFMNMTSWAESLDKSSEAFKYWLISLGISGVFLPFLVRRFSVARKNRKEKKLIADQSLKMSDENYQRDVMWIEEAVHDLEKAVDEKQFVTRINYLVRQVSEGNLTWNSYRRLHGEDAEAFKENLAEITKVVRSQLSAIGRYDRNRPLSALAKLRVKTALGKALQNIDLMKRQPKIKYEDGFEGFAVPVTAAATHWQSEQEYAHARAASLTKSVSKLGAPPLREQRTNLPDSALNTLLYRIGIKIVIWGTPDHTPSDIVGNVYYVWHPRLGFPSRKRFPLDEGLASEMGLKFFPITKADWDYIPGDQKMNAVRFHGSSNDEMAVFMVQTMDKIRFMTQMLHLYAWEGVPICDYEGRKQVFDRFADLTGDITWLQAALAVNRQTTTKKLVEPPRSQRVLPFQNPTAVKNAEEYKQKSLDKAKERGLKALDVNELRAVFSEWDRDDDKGLDLYEITNAYETLSGYNYEAAMAEAEKVLNHYKTTTIDLATFIKWIHTSRGDPEINGGGTKKGEKFDEYEEDWKLDDELKKFRAKLSSIVNEVRKIPTKTNSEENAKRLTEYKNSVSELIEDMKHAYKTAQNQFKDHVSQDTWDRITENHEHDVKKAAKTSREISIMIADANKEWMKRLKEQADDGMGEESKTERAEPLLEPPATAKVKKSDSGDEGDVDDFADDQIAPQNVGATVSSTVPQAEAKAAKPKGGVYTPAGGNGGDDGEAKGNIKPPGTAEQDEMGQSFSTKENVAEAETEDENSSSDDGSDGSSDDGSDGSPDEEETIAPTKPRILEPDARSLRAVPVVKQKMGGSTTDMSSAPTDPPSAPKIDPVLLQQLEAEAQARAAAEAKKQAEAEAAKKAAESFDGNKPEFKYRLAVGKTTKVVAKFSQPGVEGGTLIFNPRDQPSNTVPMSTDYFKDLEYWESGEWKKYESEDKLRKAFNMPSAEQEKAEAAQKKKAEAEKKTTEAKKQAAKKKREEEANEGKVESKSKESKEAPDAGAKTNEGKADESKALLKQLSLRDAIKNNANLEPKFKFTIGSEDAYFIKRIPGDRHGRSAKYIFVSDTGDKFVYHLIDSQSNYTNPKNREKQEFPRRDGLLAKNKAGQKKRIKYFKSLIAEPDYMDLVKKK